MIRPLPTFSTLLANYPDKHAVPTKSLLDSIGGQVRAGLGDAINTCAIRMSWTLNKSGAPICPTAGVSVLKGAPQVVAETAHHVKPEKHSDLFIIRVLDVKTYLTKRFGPGRAIYDGRHPRDLSKLKRGVTQGIVAFEWRGIYRDFGASGHVDLFRVTETSESPPRLVGACAGECFFLEGPMIAHLWETRP